jgi:hypothetical protein
MRQLVVRAAVAAFVGAGAVLVTAAPAQAEPTGLINVIGTEIFLTAAPAHNNLIVIHRSAEAWVFTEFGEAGLASSVPACSYPGPGTSQLACVVPGLTRIHVATAHGIDTVLNYSDAAVYLNLGDGDDSAFVGGRPGIASTVFGGAGNDTIESGAGNDHINGGDGIDTLGLGTFTYPGVDPTLPYVGVASAVTASLVTGASSRTFDADTFTQVEGLRSGGAADSLTGNDGVNVLDGGAGVDVILGGGGNDLLYGRAGADQLHGGDGDDQVWGGDGDDRLRGEAGTDTLTGEAGLDRCYTGEIVSCELRL